ncbi:nitroreductase [Mycobacterium sp. PS03-16]|uniref:nitroreductase n=1 Tax=Mycobacterium sp. PS03-16 TaxID=2559611 RepID=UPI001073E948|nr:nitroreductase [Mycobacterium sp. PS03-16]TFV54418.1 nitroreductase [Mycobacterium sp. PS03-16]
MAITVGDAASLEAVLDLAARAPSVGNSQPWRWRVAPDGVHLYADWARRLGDTDADRRDVLLSCGAVLDHCVVALAARGWRPAVRRLPDSADTGHLAMVELIGAPPDPTGARLADAIAGRRTDRRPYRQDPIPAGTLESFYAVAARLGVEFGVVPRMRWTHDGGDGVALRYGENAVAGADRNGGDGAALIGLATADDDERAALRAGEALSRIAVSAAAMGLASCPLTAPLHRVRDRLALSCDLFEGELYPQALLRVGWAPADGPRPAGGPRRTVAETTVWDLGSG